MSRALHARWPYRRSHCRHDMHWLVRVRPTRNWCRRGRSHSMAALPPYQRRPSVG
jgi:hypothetical protein